MHPRVLHKGVCAVLLRNDNNSRAQTVSAWGGGGGGGGGVGGGAFWCGCNELSLGACGAFSRDYLNQSRTQISHGQGV